MNYDQYYSLCKAAYTKDVDNNKIQKFYSEPVRVYDNNFYGDEYNSLVQTLSQLITKDFDDKIISGKALK